MKYFFMGISFMVIVWASCSPDDLKADCAMKNRSHRLLFALLTTVFIPRFREYVCLAGSKPSARNIALIPTDRLTNTVAVFNQCKANMRITIVAKANPRRDTNLGFVKELLGKFQRSHGRIWFGIRQTYIEAFGISTISPLHAAL